MTVLAARAPASLQGTAQGLFAGASGLATIIGSVAGGAIAEAIDIPGLFLLCAASLVAEPVALVLVARFEGIGFACVFVGGVTVLARGASESPGDRQGLFAGASGLATIIGSVAGGAIAEAARHPRALPALRRRRPHRHGDRGARAAPPAGLGATRDAA